MSENDGVEEVVETPKKFYALKKTCDDDNEYIYTEPSLAHGMLKKLKNSRLKIFYDKEEALRWSRSEEDTLSQSIRSVDLESSDFKSPPSRSLALFRSLIEIDDLESVYYMIQENPRYLVSVADKPTILMEGPRYNAVLVACRFNSHECLKIILNTIEDINFIEKLYPNDDEKISQQKRDVLLDAYLNTPDKAAFETPLHFACKNGFKLCVEILLSYTNCDRTRMNKFGKTAFEIIGSHQSNLSPRLQMQCSEQNEIKLLFEQKCFVTVNRDEEKVSLSMHEDTLPLDDSSIKAVVGPMSPKVADKIYSFFRSPRTLPPIEAQIRLTDDSKGIERLLRKECKKTGVSWSEYWPFMDRFCDLSTEEGLQFLELHLRSKEDTPELNDSTNLSTNETSKTSNLTTGDTLYEDAGSPKKNLYNTSIESPISSLCKHFNQLKLNSPTSQFNSPRSSVASPRISLMNTPKIRNSSRNINRSCNSSLNSSLLSLSLIEERSDDDDDDDCESECFRTPPTSPAVNSHNFVNGPKFTDCDRNAAIALNDVNVDPFRYPYVNDWLKRVHKEPAFLFKMKQSSITKKE